MRRRAFTLIEMMVAIGIIVLLAGLTVPLFSMVKARGESAKCLGNLRGLGVALSAYLAEHDSTMPDLKAGRASRNEDVPVIDNTLNSYVDDQRVFACPADRRYFRDTGTSYYWDSALNGQRLAALNLFGMVSDLGRIPVLVDKEGWHTYSDNKVNHLFADGHATKELRLFTE
ncbi:prepilin-type N-terminal cleavage/methylation domain-containing protein [Terrimicrobium sacchariphilum]|uniref:Prepilin-type N-terminal cleavage/methylation domain-containing protein n=1 Tax=Terrimicrobium sacchariphilum TaxID=690879 RepID=A0A146GB04_TERSA|nr:type II secretion system protein [Terrimicrobium sacchariphilum]GAT34809.1 prepilin-type N-terminal cleavage/methylation domain-containing protein [Terrimicrobium sacchariphilum]